MRCITRRTEYPSRSDVFRLYLIADPHLGNIHSDEKLLRGVVQEIRDDSRAYWIGLGDMCEYINKRDPRFDTDELADWLIGRAQLRDIARTETAHALSILQPIKGKCLGLVEGNHERSIAQHSETDVYSTLIEGLADEHEHRLDHRGFITWALKRMQGSTWALRIHATHGSNGGRRPGSTANRLEDLAGQIDGVDVVMQGHTHKPAYLPLSKFRVGRNRTENVTVHAINAPAMCSDMAYADRQDMRPVPIGYTMLEIRPDTKQIAVNTCVS